MHPFKRKRISEKSLQRLSGQLVGEDSIGWALLWGLLVRDGLAMLKAFQHFQRRLHHGFTTVANP